MHFLIKYLFVNRVWLDCKYRFAKVFQVLWEIIIFYQVKKISMESYLSWIENCDITSSSYTRKFWRGIRKIMQAMVAACKASLGVWQCIPPRIYLPLNASDTDILRGRAGRHGWVSVLISLSCTSSVTIIIVHLSPV